jgi:hypothetical protein
VTFIKTSYFPLNNIVFLLFEILLGKYDYFEGEQIFISPLCKGNKCFIPPGQRFGEFCQMKSFGHLCFQNYYFSTYIEIQLVETIPRDIYQNIIFPSQQHRISLIQNSQDLTLWRFVYPRKVISHISRYDYFEGEKMFISPLCKETKYRKQHRIPLEKKDGIHVMLTQQ